LLYLRNCHRLHLSPPSSVFRAPRPPAAPYAAGATWLATRRALLAPHLPQHELPQPASPWLRVELSRTPARAPARHDVDGRRRSLALRPRHPSRPPPARTPQFALLPLPVPIKGVGLPLHVRTSRSRHSQLRASSAHRGTTLSAPTFSNTSCARPPRPRTAPPRPIPLRPGPPESPRMVAGPHGRRLP